MKESIKKFRDEARKLEESDALQEARRKYVSTSVPSLFPGPGLLGKVTRSLIKRYQDMSRLPRPPGTDVFWTAVKLWPLGLVLAFLYRAGRHSAPVYQWAAELQSAMPLAQVLLYSILMMPTSPQQGLFLLCIPKLFIWMTFLVWLQPSGRCPCHISKEWVIWE